MTVTIRQARQNDVISLAHFAEHTFRETFSSDNLASNINLHCLQNFSFDIQLQEILNSGIMTFLAEDKPKLVGFAQLRLDPQRDLIMVTEVI